jgi:hypothetical protein
MYSSLAFSHLSTPPHLKFIPASATDYKALPFIYKEPILTFTMLHPIHITVTDIDLSRY